MDTVREKYKDEMDTNFVCYLSKEFANWIVEIQGSNDEWLKTKCNVCIYGS